MSKLNTIMIGCGGVGLAVLELSTMGEIDLGHVTIYDPRDIMPEVKEVFSTEHVTHVPIELTRNNLSYHLEKMVECKANIMIDVSYNIFFKPLIKWCQRYDIIYINTSLERWPLKNEHILDKNIYNRTLHKYHEIARKMNKENSTTAILEHGMNPGLISHMTKHAIISIAKQYGLDTNKSHAELAEQLRIRTIHCSEIDNQIPYVRRQEDEFMNTWGPYSFYSEGVDPVQIGKGTHEILDKEFVEYKQCDNQFFIKKRGICEELVSYVPYEEITGFAISHGENDTISRFLSTETYRPSQYYVYSPCFDALCSMIEVRKRNYKMLPKQKALRGKNIERGRDRVGALLMLENTNGKVSSFWCGSILGIEDTRKLGIKFSGPTTIQVAISIIAALEWAKENRNKGICFPEVLPSERILKRCQKYLGVFFQDWVDYEPPGLRYQDNLI